MTKALHFVLLCTVLSIHSGAVNGQERVLDLQPGISKDPLVVADVVPVPGFYEIPKEFDSWSLFLICNPNWLLSENQEKLADLYNGFRAFGRAIGTRHAAVWFFKDRSAYFSVYGRSLIGLPREGGGSLVHRRLLRFPGAPGAAARRLARRRSRRPRPRGCPRRPPPHPDWPAACVPSR